jgi:hypothetical protein
MKKLLTAMAFTMVVSAAPAFAGALTLEIGHPEANPEARAMNVTVVARVTACHEPGKSTVKAYLLQMVNGELRRTALNVVPMKALGTFAVIGTVPKGSAIDLAVTNPQFENYEPRVLVRVDDQGIQWAGMKRFYSKPPTDDDLRNAVKTVD